MKKEKKLTTQTPEQKVNYLRQDLKKLLIIISILIVILVGLALADARFGILTKFAKQIIPQK